MKAVCSKHYVAYETTSGCADCAAYELRPDQALGAAWTDSASDSLVDLAEFARRFPTAPGRDANGSDVDDSELDPFCIAMLGCD